MRRLFGAVLFVLVAASFSAAETGAPAPDFTLSDTEGKSRSLHDYRGKLVVLEWYNPGCPFVKKHYGSGNMPKLQKEYTAKDVIWLTVVSSARGKQGNLDPKEHEKTLRDWGGGADRAAHR